MAGVRSKRLEVQSGAEVRVKSGRAATVKVHGSGVTTVTLKNKSGRVTVIRSSRTGRFTAAKSAKVIDRGAERFAGPLKRLATR
jgi:hypothetical protein